MSASADFQKGLTAYNRGDFATALRIWKPLAKQGNADAQTNLGVMYFGGKGVKRDNIIAYFWFDTAASNSTKKTARQKHGRDTALKNRDIVAKRMTPADISTAQKLARECVRKKYKGC